MKVGAKVGGQHAECQMYIAQSKTKIKLYELRHAHFTTILNPSTIPSTHPIHPSLQCSHIFYYKILSPELDCVQMQSILGALEVCEKASGTYVE